MGKSRRTKIRPKIMDDYHVADFIKMAENLHDVIIPTRVTRRLCLPVFLLQY